MVLLAFHWSRIYRKKLMNKKIYGTILKGNRSFQIDDEILAYVSEKESLMDGTVDHRIGTVKIKEVHVMKVKDLAGKEVEATGYESMEELKNTLKHWYDASEDTVITFVGFDLKLI